MPSAKLKDYTIHFDNSKEYHILKREIFGSHCYYTEFDRPDPVIIDAGAHIGLATLYFKDTYPQAQITDIEPHPQSFKLLEQNIWENRLTQVSAINVGLAAEAGELVLYQDSTDDHWYSTVGHKPGAWNNSQAHQTPITVPAKPLTDFLKKPIDLLKLDIEGLETTVLKAAGTSLHMVKKMLIEYHPDSGSAWEDLADYLDKLGFITTASKHGQTLKPDRKSTGLVLLEAISQDRFTSPQE